MQSVKDFLKAVKDRLHAPEGQMAVDDDTIVKFLNEELNTEVWPYLCSLRKNWNVVKKVIKLDDNYQLNRIPVPRRAFASGIREIKYSDTVGGNPYNLPEISIEELDQWNTSIQSNRPIGYYIENDCIVLTGTKNKLSGEVHIWYVLSPSIVVANKTVGSTIDGVVKQSSGEAHISFYVPIDDPSYVNKLIGLPMGVYKFDIFRMSSGSVIIDDRMGSVVNSGYGFPKISTYGEDFLQTIKMYYPNIMPNDPNPYFGLADVRDLVITDAEYINYIPVPKAADAWVVCLVAKRVLESIGDTEGMGILAVQAEKAKTDVTKVLGVRNQGESKAFNSRRGIFGYIGFNSRYRR